MSKLKEFLVRKDIVISPQRYLIDALGAMAQGLFASLLIGTIIKTVGQQTGLALLVDLGGYATAMSGPAMACAIGWALHCPPLVLFSLITVGYSANALGGAGGPLAVLIIAIVAAELGKAVSKETKVDILVTPLVTIFSGVGLSMLIAAPIGAAASQVGTLIMWATEQAPLVMGILVSVIVGVALTLPFSSAAICAANGVLLREPLNPSPPADAQAMVLPLESVIVTIVLLNVERICAAPDSTCFLSFLFALLFTVAILSLLQHYFLVAVFLPAIVFLGPLRVRAFVFVRCPRVGSPSR